MTATRAVIVKLKSQNYSYKKKRIVEITKSCAKFLSHRNELKCINALIFLFFFRGIGMHRYSVHTCAFASLIAAGKTLARIRAPDLENTDKKIDSLFLLDLKFGDRFKRSLGPKYR